MLGSRYMYIHVCMCVHYTVYVFQSHGLSGAGPDSQGHLRSGADVVSGLVRPLAFARRPQSGSGPFTCYRGWRLSSSGLMPSHATGLVENFTVDDRNPA